jgi:menaquinone-specific isochorismate synthase
MPTAAASWLSIVVFMSVFFNQPLLLKTPYHLADFLTECHLAFLQGKQARFVSIAFVIRRFHPLAILQASRLIHSHHFYFEREADCFIGLGKAIQLTVESRDRFAQTRELLEDLSGQILRVNAFASANAATIPNNRFFCNFAFFEQNPSANLTTPQATILLPRWQVAQTSTDAFAIANLALHPNFIPELEARKVWQELAVIKQARSFTPNSTNITYQTQTVAGSKRYQESVKRALQSIAQGQLDKVVLAEALDVVADRPFDRIAALHNLRHQHPSCYIFSASSGADETFIGASPERLAAVQAGQLQTEALAGSAPRGRTDAEDLQFAQALLTSEKEAHEHQLVIDFIQQRLDGLGISSTIEPARLLQLANIQHRHTPIGANLPTNVHILDVIGTLHPTPAMAGLPREIACQHIQHYEACDRGWYAAPIGWVDTAGNGEFAVGIRSALLQGNRARLFAGAGIVAGSDPEREYQEVQLKLNALLTALNPH